MKNIKACELSGEKENTLFVSFLFCLLLMACSDRNDTNGPENRTGNVFDINVDHVLLAELGNERKKNAAYRVTADGEERIVSWGYRILEWAVEPDAQVSEVVSEIEGLWFSNGGTVMDVNGNGNEEVIVARDEVGSYAAEAGVVYEGDLENVELLWYEPVSGSQKWVEHQVAIFEESAPMISSPLLRKHRMENPKVLS